MSQTYSFHTLDVFTEQIFGGNPLAVFPEAQGLNTQKMQAIAKELNLSETVFVLPPEQADCDFKLRIFTPLAEIPFAGHPTVGTAYLLAHLELIETGAALTNFKEGIGKVPVSLQWKDGKIQNTFLQAAQLPEFDIVPNINMAKLLGLNSEDIHADSTAEVISCGLPFLYICLKNIDAVDRSLLNTELWKSIAESTAANVYILAIAPNDHHIYARMFAPALGISEDPATGSAATSLAGYLNKYFPSDTAQEIWQIQQGFEMGRPSQLSLTLNREKGRLKSIQVGGASVLVSQGQMRVA
ncbi:MAG: PhzF family phenazine biosynthesis protein [Limnothrix sp.]